MTNTDTTDNIEIAWTEKKKVTDNRYLEQTTAMENRTRQDVSIRIKAGRSFGGKVQKNLS